MFRVPESELRHNSRVEFVIVGAVIRLVSILLAVPLCLAIWLSTGSDTPGASQTAGADADHWPPEVEPRTWKYIVLHHTASESGDVASIDRDHRQRKDSQGRPWRGIGYHFLIGNGHPMADGAVEATFRWKQQLPGAHSGDREHNDAGIGICLVGNFNQHPPSKEQLAALERLLKVLRQRYQIDAAHVLTHRDVRETQCPGKLFPYRQVLGRDIQE